MNKSRSAAVILEILVSMVILFMTIFVVTATIKRLNQVYVQKKLYEELYLSVLSLMDDIDATTCRAKKREGQINGFAYDLQCRQMGEMLSDEENLVRLLRVDLHFTKKGLDKRFLRYLTYIEKGEHAAN